MKELAAVVRGCRADSFGQDARGGGVSSTALLLAFAPKPFSPTAEPGSIPNQPLADRPLRRRPGYCVARRHFPETEAGEGLAHLRPIVQ